MHSWLALLLILATGQLTAQIVICFGYAAGEWDYIHASLSGIQQYLINMSTKAYSRDRLLEIGREVLSHQATLRIPLDAYIKLKDFNIPSMLPTFRGKRGGLSHNSNKNF